MEGKIGGIVVALLIAGGLFWMKYNNKGNDKQDLRDVAHQVLESADNYDEHESDYEYYFDIYHDEAFERNYRMGGRRSSASFDEDSYWNEMFASMIQSATADGETEVAEGLTSLRDRMFGVD